MYNFIFSSIAHKLLSVVTLKADRSFGQLLLQGHRWLKYLAQAESTGRKSLECHIRTSVALLP